MPGLFNLPGSPHRWWGGQDPRSPILETGILLRDRRRWCRDLHGPSNRYKSV